MGKQRHDAANYVAINLQRSDMAIAAADYDAEQSEGGCRYPSERDDAPSS